MADEKAFAILLVVNYWEEVRGSYYVEPRPTPKNTRPGGPYGHPVQDQRILVLIGATISL
jgi:hypothetical protein